jgi:hypothetical protein
VDALEGTDASAYTLGNGVTIKVSGRMNPSAQALCVKECKDQAQVEAQVEAQQTKAVPETETAELAPVNETSDADEINASPD